MLDRYVENTSDQSLSDLKEDLIKTIRNGEWRTVIIALDEAGSVRGMFFPLDDLRLRHDMDIAACELVQFVDQDENHPEKTLFGHLGVNKAGQLIVEIGSDARSRAFDEDKMTKLVQEYFNERPTAPPTPPMKQLGDSTI